MFCWNNIFYLLSDIWLQKAVFFSAGQCASPLQNQRNHRNATCIQLDTPSHIMASEPWQFRFHLVDYKVWSVMQEQVYTNTRGDTPIPDVGLNDLKPCLLDTVHWATLDQRIINKKFVNLNFGR